MKITRRKFIGLAASVAILPSGLLGRQITSSPGGQPRTNAKAKVASPRAKIARKIFLDESGNDSGRYVVAGCLAVDASLARDVKRELLKSTGTKTRLGWNRLGRTSLESHRRMMTAIFEAIDRGQLSFDYVIAPNRNWERSSQTGYSAAAHKLLIEYAAVRRDTHKLYLYPQQRPVNASIEAYRRALNREVSGGASDSIPIRLIEYRDTHRSILNQALDVIVGALAYRANGYRGLSGASAPKRALADHVAARIELMPRNSA